VFKAHSHFHHSTLGLRVIHKKKVGGGEVVGGGRLWGCVRIARAVTIPNIGVLHYIGVPHRVTYPYGGGGRGADLARKRMERPAAMMPSGRALLTYAWFSVLPLRDNAPLIFHIRERCFTACRLCIIKQFCASGWGVVRLRVVERAAVGAGSVSHPREFFIGNLLVRIHFIIVMIRWAGLALWEFQLPFRGSLTSAFLEATTHHKATISLQTRSVCSRRE